MNTAPKITLINSHSRGKKNFCQPIQLTQPRPEKPPVTSQPKAATSTRPRQTRKVDKQKNGSRCGKIFSISFLLRRPQCTLRTLLKTTDLQRDRRSLTIPNRLTYSKVKRKKKQSTTNETRTAASSTEPAASKNQKHDVSTTDRTTTTNSSQTNK